MMKHLLKYKYTIAALLLVLIIFHVLLNRTAIMDYSGGRFLKLVDPKAVATDSKGNMYILDNMYKRVIKIKPDKQVVYVLHGERRSPGGFFLAYNLKVDEGGNLYLYNEVIDRKTSNTSIAQIIRYDASGKFDKVLLEFKADEEYNTPLGYDFQVKNNALYYILDSNGAQEVHKLSLESGKDAMIKKVEMDTSEFNNFEVLPNDKIVYTTFSGKMFNDLGPVTGLRIPAFLCVYDKNTYVLDLYTNGFFKMDPGQPLLKLADQYRLKAWGYHENEMILNSLALTPEGRLLTADLLKQRILIIDVEKQTVQFFDACYFSFARMVGLAAWLAEISIGMLIMLYLIFSGILRIRKYLLAKQLIVFVCIFVSAVLVITISTYKYVNQNYEAELKNRLLNVAQYGAKLIDADAFDRIKGPEDFGNEDFEKIQKQVDDSIHNAKNEWNSDMYAEVYKVKGQHFYLDYSGVYNYDDVTEIHKKAYNQGKIGFTEYVDGYGTWLAGVAPIFNSIGAIVGVYECYIDGDLLKERSQDFVKKLILNILLFSVLFIAAFITYVRYDLKPIKQLKQAIDKVARHNYTESLDIRRKDEIGNLADGFNQMIRELDNYSTHLEDLVAIRTEELKNALDELGETQVQLVQTEKMAVMGQLVAGIVHELNTPLGSLKSNMDIEKLLLSKLDAVGNDGIQGFREKTDKLYMLDEMAVNRMIDFIKHLKGFISLDESELKSAAINECIENTLMILRHELHEKVTINTYYGDMVPIYCYPKQLNLALMNILINVSRISGMGTELDIITESDESKVSIRILKKGDDISEELQNLFNPSFVTANSRISSGMGLASAYKTVELHKGKIGIIKKGSEGTEIMIELPVNAVFER